MTIYNQISSNRIRSVLIMIAFVFLFTGFFFLIGKFFNGQGYFIIGLIVSLLSAVGSYFYSDKIVLWINRAQPADKKTFFDFYTVTENLAIADGIPMPKIYVIDDPAPNAFATGRNPKHAVICATTGLLNKLERSEVEGVISHELSHVKNYDILLSTLVAVLVGTIAYASDWMMRSLWWGGIGGRDDDRDRRNPLMLIGMIVALVLIPIAATLIQLAVSRQREFLADASGALLTRNPEGLASALEKISADPNRMSHANNATAHLFISNPLKNIRRGSWIAGLFSTHPPIEERVRLLRSM